MMSPAGKGRGGKRLGITGMEGKKGEREGGQPGSFIYWAALTAAAAAAEGSAKISKNLNTQ